MPCQRAPLGLRGPLVLDQLHQSRLEWLEFQKIHLFEVMGVATRQQFGPGGEGQDGEPTRGSWGSWAPPPHLGHLLTHWGVWG